MSMFAELAGSWRLAVRLARRTARRNKARTVLIVLMLALPVYAGSVLAMSYSATYTSADAEASWRLGRADYSIEGAASDKVLATLPAGTQTARVTYGRTPVGVGDRYGLRDYVAADVQAPLTSGMFQVRAGRAPHGAGEVAVSARLAASDRIGLGDRVLVGLPPTARAVVGIVDAAWELSLPIVVSPAEQRLSGDLPHTLVKLPPGVGWQPPNIDELMNCADPASGGRACSVDFGWMYRPDAMPSAVELATRKAALVLVVGFAGTQVALLTGAAFAIGARRQRRELAMLGAVGASRPQLARLVLAHGLVLGAAAGGLGLGLGALTYWLNRHRVEQIANHPLNPNNVPVWWLAGIALFAVAVGLLAAVGPARGAARQSLRDELAGRESTTTAGSLRWLAGGTLVAGGGAAGAVYAAGSSGSIVMLAAATVAILLGVAAFAPVLIAVTGRFAARLPLAVRLAARHAARHRLRTAASVAAVCAATAGSMALMLYGAADTAQKSRDRQPDAPVGQVVIPADAAARLKPEQVRAIEAALPTRASLPVTALTTKAGVFDSPHPPSTAVMLPSRSIAVGATEANQTDLIRAVTGAEPPPTALTTLRAGGAVAFYPDLLRDGRLHIGADLTVPAVLVPAPGYYTNLPGALISNDTAAQHRLTTHAGGVLVDTTRSPTAAEFATANARTLAAQLQAEPSALPAELLIGAKRGMRGRDYGSMFLVLAAVSGLVTFAASAVAVGLATSEMRNDLSTLAAAGAGPRLRRRIAGAQAGLIVGIGVLLGLLGGIAPAAGMVAFRADLDWRVPWLPLVLTIIIVPLLAITGTAMLTRPRLILIRRLD